jgi:hypothetical protein
MRRRLRNVNFARSFSPFVPFGKHEVPLEPNAFDGFVQHVAAPFRWRFSSERCKPLRERSQSRRVEKFLDELSQTSRERWSFTLRSERREDWSGSRDRDVRVASSLRLVDGAKKDAPLFGGASDTAGELLVSVRQHREPHPIEIGRNERARDNRHLRSRSFERKGASASLVPRANDEARAIDELERDGKSGSHQSEA